MKKFIALALVAALSISLVACSSEEETTEETTDDQSTVQDVEETEGEAEDDMTEEEGEAVAAMPGATVTMDGNVYTVVYVPEENGFLTEMTVTVELDDAGTIVAVEVVDNQGQLYPTATEALTSVPAAMVAANSADVDIVAEATITSEAIIAAVKAALEA